jgi:hypothetical protein
VPAGSRRNRADEEDDAGEIVAVILNVVFNVKDH